MTMPAPGGTAAEAPRRPPLVRPSSDRMLAGVAAGTAAHLGLDPLVVRMAFVVLGSVGVGVVMYGLLWLLMPVGELPERAEGGPPAAGRGATVAGMAAQGAAFLRQQRNPRQVAVLVVLGVAAVSLVGKVASSTAGSILVPAVVLLAGLAVIWRQLDTDRTLGRPGVRWVLAGGGLLAALGVVLLLATTGQLANARNGFAATLVILVGVVLVTAPLWRRLLSSREAERAARVRSEERAAVAAHLHDSVLQTLALIQRHADEPQAVSRLARSQERELRAWLYEPAAAAGGTWAALVAGLVADVEADHALTVDPVVVGDAPVDESLAALGAATREALVNVGKHAGVTSADLYTEVGPERVSVFVRDRGKGFDPETVPADRRGLRDSLRGRLERVGGTAVVRSHPGEGTEVELILPRAVTA